MAVGTTREASKFKPYVIPDPPSVFALCQYQTCALIAPDVWSYLPPPVMVGLLPTIFRIASLCWTPRAALFPPCPRRNSPLISGTELPTTANSSGYARGALKNDQGRARTRNRTAVFTGRFSSAVGTMRLASKPHDVPVPLPPEPRSPESHE